MTYYRLYDNQCDRFMATGYNTTSKEQLCEEYAEYKSNDWDEDEQLKVWNEKMTLEDKINFIEDDEFTIETSEVKFEEDN